MESVQPAARIVAVLLAAAWLAAPASAEAVPVNADRPSIAGTAVDGQTLTTSNGTWTAGSPLTFGYQWRRCDASGTSCSDIAGATQASYVLTSPDVGATIRATVIATDPSGSASATSAPTAAVAPAPPVAVARPVVSGMGREGETLTASTGTWKGTTPMWFRYSWRRCDLAGTNCLTVAGATAATYTLTAADVDTTLRVRVYATNAAGTASSYSFATPVITPPCPRFATKVQTGVVSLADADELSGIAAGRRNPGVLWSHNDSGDTERIFAFATNAAYLGTYVVSPNPQSDWEDIAVGPGPEPGVSYIYIGSIGGNGGRHSIYVYRAPEPPVSTTQTPLTTTLDGVVKLRMQYPGTEAYNAESLMVDTLTRDIYVATKSYSGTTKVFRYPAEAQDPAITYTLQRVKTLKLPAGATAADISADGSAIAIKGYQYALLWQRPPGASVTAALDTPACTIPPAPGEAIGFAPDGSGYFTVAEGTAQPFYWFARLPG